MRQPPETVRLKLIAGAALFLTLLAVASVDQHSPPTSRAVVIYLSLGGVLTMIVLWFYHASRSRH